MNDGFREHLFPPGHPRLAGLDRCDSYSYVDEARRNPIVAELLSDWGKRFETEDFRGITDDGAVIAGLFPLGCQENAPTASAVTAAEQLLAELTPRQRTALGHPLDSRVWRAWMNPEFYVNRFGLRLEETDARVRRRALRLVQTCLSPEGYAKVRDVMRVNGFLGELVGLPKILNEHSYNINLFGVPSRDRPWGWNLYGHHLCLNCLLIGDQLVFTPVFFGAEPNCIDQGPYAGTVLFTAQQQAGLNLIRSMPPELADEAVLFRRKRDPGLPPGRLHPGDELHLGGAFQDNRIIGCEGLNMAGRPAALRAQLLALADAFLDYLPAGPRSVRLDDVRRHLDRTWFCWIGGTTDADPFYYRIQSPVVLIEFDHHAGVFLANSEPERFHVHTIVRTPNGNDYGAELVRHATGAAHRLNGPA